MKILVLVACAALPLAARAQPTEPLWEFGLGATGLRVPDYRGSSENRYYLLPIPYFVYRGDKLRVDRQGPRAKVFESSRLELDFSTLITPPVDSSKNHAREGMPSLDPTVEIGPQVNYIVARDVEKDWRFDVRLPVRAVVATDIKHSHGAGYTIYPHAYYSGHPELFGARWNLGLQAGPLFGSRDYHAYFYSVAPQFATASRPAFEAPGGYSGTAVSGSLGRRFGKLWAGGFMRYDTLRGAAFETSPLVQQKYSVTAGLAFAWVFAESSERVAGREF
jgi:outer membrane scaffolding protein for murein synthesis (MipA/OmpV family)